MYRSKLKVSTTVLVLAVLLSACGGGGDSNTEAAPEQSKANILSAKPAIPPNLLPITTPIRVVPIPPILAPSRRPTQEQAANFLLKSTMGIKPGDTELVIKRGYIGWINNQFNLPHVNTKDRFDVLWNAELKNNPSTPQYQDWFYYAFWKGAINDEDQLRQRVNWALSQIFVVSFLNANTQEKTRGVANYYDLLGKHAFGNYRDMLYDITMNPMMGHYLTYLWNQKEDPYTGRIPDENYAREVMQLFTIGLYQLNLNGTVKTDGSGNPIYTYTQPDIKGLAKVFTGLGYGLPNSNWGVFQNIEEDIVPMKVFPAYQTAGKKIFLGQAATNISESIDVLFNHPNVGPFFAKQMIQRLVTSNPSPAYVERVAKAFNDNGKGIRGDMKAVIIAILTDSDTQEQVKYDTNLTGKLKEPVLRMSNYLRATNTKSISENFMMTNTDDSSYSLGQTPMRSPSVFNFYRPGYAPAQSNIAKAGKVAPEFALVDENSVAGYANIMLTTINSGIGNNFNNTKDLQPDLSSFISLSEDTDKLISYIDLLLTGGKMNTKTKALIKSSVNAMPIASELNKKRRVQQALFLTVVSSDFLIQ